jgi:hypothetical protein
MNDTFEKMLLIIMAKGKFYASTELYAVCPVLRELSMRKCHQGNRKYGEDVYIHI